MPKTDKLWAPNTEALDDYIWTYIPLNESADNIEHHGVKGQKWGVRRYQNRDGSLTPEGMKRYNVIHTKDGRTFYREKNYKQLKVQKIFDSLSEADKVDLPEKIIDPDHTVYESYRRSSFLTLEGHVTDQDAHPVKGLVVRVGTAENERGKGDAGYLVRQAIREKPHNDFVAEISPGNETAADFFINNGFEYVMTENGIDYYRFDAPGDNVDKVMADLSEKRKVRRHENRLSVDVPVTHSDIWNPSELYHHGIKGQKWGVRRFQNPDGSLTEAGKKRVTARNRVIRAHRTSDSVNSIINSMDKDEKEKLAVEDDEEYLTFEQGASVAKRILISDASSTPVSFFDLLEDDDGRVNVALGTKSGPEYRGKGYASKAAKQGMKWYEANKEKFGYKEVIWGVRTDNAASIRIAEKNGFKIDPNSYSADGKWVNYTK